MSFNKEDRKENILLDIVEEYIKTAEPVSSQEILDKYKYNLSSATIRSIMSDLTEAGFLIQPHTSSGRLPTHKAYRFYVNKVELGVRKPVSASQKLEKETLKKEIRKATKISSEYTARVLSQRLAELTNSVAFAGILGINHFYREGLLHILNEPEFLNAENIRMLVEYTDILEGHVESLYSSIQNDIRTYIGPEYEGYASPFSLMAFSSKLPNHQKAVFGILGPMRMQYNRNLELMESVKELFDNLK